MIGILTALLSGALMSFDQFCAVYGTSGLSCDLVFCGWEKFYDAYTDPG